MTRVPVKRENTDTWGRELCDVGGRNGSGAATSQGHQGLLGATRPGRDREGVIPWSLVEGWFCQILDFRLLAWNLTFLLFYLTEFVVMTDLRNEHTHLILLFKKHPFFFSL